MRKLTCVFAVAAIGGLVSFASASSAGPMAAGLAGAKSMIPAVGENSVQQVHGWHCRKRYGWYRGHKYWHRHWRACEDDDYSYYNPYAFYGAPFFFYFDDDDGHKRRRHKHRRYKKKHDYDD